MKPLFVLWCLLIGTQLGFGQGNQRARLVRIPIDRGIISIVSQPECPLRIVEAELLTKEDGQYPIIRYVLRNASPKPIRYFSVGFNMKYSIQTWHRFGSGHEDGVGHSDGKGPNLIYKDQTYSNWQEQEFQIVPMNGEVEALLHSKPEERRLKFLGIGMVTKAIFSDGTVCEAGRQYSELGDVM